MKIVRTLAAVAVLAATTTGVGGLAPAPTAVAAGGYTALAPTRILDTREGLGAAAAPIGPGATIDVQVTGVGNVPTDGVAAVVLNLTGTQPTAATFVTAYPAGGTREGSNLNLLPGQTDANLVVATVGTGGKVSLYNAFGNTHLIADVAGWFPAGSGYRPLAPARILDTRDGNGAAAAPVGADAAIDVQVTGVGGVPSTGVGAVVLNLTGTEHTAATFISAYPAGGTREGSNLNLFPGSNDANLVIATVGNGGKVSLYNAFGTTHLIADVAGWFPAGSDYGALAPARVLDTREGLGAPQAPLGAGATIDVQVTGVGGVPSTGVGAVVLNLTGTNPTAPTFLSAYPAGTAQAGSNLNLLPGQTDANAVIATVGEGGKVSVYNPFGTVDVIADVAGWFAASLPASGTFIAYTCGFNLCAIDPVTKAQIALTTDGTEESWYDWPSVSADGTLLAAGRDDTVVVGPVGGALDETWVEDSGINDVALAPDGSGVAHSWFHTYYGMYPCWPNFCYGVVVSNGTGYSPAGPADDATQVYQDYGGWGLDFLPDGTVLAAEYLAFDRSMICRYLDPTDPNEPCDEIVTLSEAEADWVSEPDASPDGTLVAAGVGAPGENDESVSVQVYSLATGEHVRTLAPDGDSPSFSPDGASVVFEGSDGWLYIVPSAGGAPTRLVEGTSPTWARGDLP